MQHECRITVLETKCFPELQEQYLADPKSGPCPFFKPGNTFLIKRTPQQDDFYHLMEGRFCGEAWDAVIVVMVRTADKRQAEFWIEDGAIASAYILLAIEQYGLGACWVHIRNRMGQRGTSDQEIRSLLGVPDGYTVLNLVAIGEKAEEKRAYTDADLHTENVHYEKY